MLDGIDEDMCLEESGNKKRRLSVEQVKALEKNFEVENKLEPERKVKLAQELGLQPRQVAVWFQNRRGQWKTKQLEKDYSVLKANFDSLKHNYESLQHDRDSLLKEADQTGGWMSLGGILLCITGSEAIFADLGHFSQLPIKIAFTCVVYPSLILAYMGQAAYLSQHHEMADGQRIGFYVSVPENLR